MQSLYISTDRQVPQQERQNDHAVEHYRMRMAKQVEAEQASDAAHRTAEAGARLGTLLANH